MKLNKQQIDRTVDIMISENSPIVNKIDSDAYLYGRDSVDDIISLIIDSPSILTDEQFQSIYETFTWNSYQLVQGLTERGMETGDIILELYYSQRYIYNKLIEISDYFAEIQYFEGCANIKKIIDILQDVK